MHTGNIAVEQRKCTGKIFGSRGEVTFENIAEIVAINRSKRLEVVHLNFGVVVQGAHAQTAE